MVRDILIFKSLAFVQIDIFGQREFIRFFVKFLNFIDKFFKYECKFKIKYKVMQLLIMQKQLYEYIWYFGLYLFKFDISSGSQRYIVQNAIIVDRNAI